MYQQDPFSLINVNADSIMRGVTLALPTASVRHLLPAGLELGEQQLTPPGTHPLTLLFNDMFRVNMNITPLFPAQTYRELIVGIPYTFLSKTSYTPGYPGPYYYMPKLFLDNLSATMGGLFIWGFPKELGSMQVTGDRYTVSSLGGQALATLSWQPSEARYRTVAETRNFEPTRRLLSQPNIALAPAASGPFFVRSDFDRDWDASTLQPIRAAVQIHVSFIPGLECKRYPEEGFSEGIDASVLGSYVLQCPWRLSLPYPPMLSMRAPGA